MLLLSLFAEVYNRVATDDDDDDDDEACLVWLLRVASVGRQVALCLNDDNRRPGELVVSVGWSTWAPRQFVCLQSKPAGFRAHQNDDGVASCETEITTISIWPDRHTVCL